MFDQEIALRLRWFINNNFWKQNSIRVRKMDPIYIISRTLYPGEKSFSHNGVSLLPSMSFSYYKLKDGDVIDVFVVKAQNFRKRVSEKKMVTIKLDTVEKCYKYIEYRLATDPTLSRELQRLQDLKMSHMKPDERMINDRFQSFNGISFTNAECGTEISTNPLPVYW